MGVDRKTGILASGDFDILPKLEGAGSSFQLLMDGWLLVNKAKGGNVFVSCHEYALAFVIVRNIMQVSVI